MEVIIDASEYKPEELRCPCNQEDFLWKESTRRTRKTAVLISRRASPGVTPFRRRHERTRWSPISPLRVSSSSPLPRVHLLSQMRPREKSEILFFMLFN